MKVMHIQDRKSTMVLLITSPKTINSTFIILEKIPIPIIYPVVEQTLRSFLFFFPTTQVF